MSIETKIYPNPWPKKVMYDCLDAGYQCIKGTDVNQPNTVLCYAFLMIGYQESNLLNIGVNPDFQRQALATQMLHRLLLISRINRAKHMWLEVRASNQPAIKLYKKFNFKQVGLRKNYYQYIDTAGKKIKEHALLMSKNVAD